MNWKNGVYIVTRLMAAFSLKDYQAVGFAGNFMAESHCNPTSVNKAEKAGKFKGSSANGAGYGAGLAQWSNAWKKKIQDYFKKYTPIETWSMDEQLNIVIKCCSPKFINLLRNSKSVAESVDIVLRGYENGSGGYGTYLRPKHGPKSMDGYTWAKTVYIADTGNQTFSGGYLGLLTSRVSYANKILKTMGSMSKSDLSQLAAESGEGGSFSVGSDGSSSGGVPISLDAASIQKLVEAYRNAYPVHSEYETYTGPGGNLFNNSKENAFTLAAVKQNDMLNSGTFNTKDGKHTRTRIYSTNDALIVLDELKIPLDVSAYAVYENQGITEGDVIKRQEQLEKEKEEAQKKKQEEEQKKLEEQKKQETQNKTTTTGQNKEQQKQETQTKTNN